MSVIVLDGGPLSCHDLARVAAGAAVRADPDALARMAHNAAQVPVGETSVLEAKRAWLLGEHARSIPAEDLARAFVLDHCAGVGPLFEPGVVRATMAARANALLVGVSAVRPQIVEGLLTMLSLGIIPDVPSQGSVGAAGDLAPMAHIARVLFQLDGPIDGLPPIAPTPKEALAVINGVSLTAALSALAVHRTTRVLDTAVVALAMTMEAVGADAGCIDDRAIRARLHKGPIAIAARLRDLLTGTSQVTLGRKPDAFSIRCAPQVLGAAAEALAHCKAVVEIELQGVSDNPLLFGEGDAAEWIEAGNFHGAPLALAMDHIKLALAQIATVSERRTFRLSYGQLTPGLPSFLVEGTGLNSGFMLAQYTAASLASEIKGLSHPASVDTIPTVQHHEDHVSMGPIAARTALECAECAADIVGIELLLAAQALDLRMRGVAEDADREKVDAAPITLAPRVNSAWARVRADIEYWADDGVLHPCLVAAGELVRSGALLDGDTHPGW